MKLKILFLIYFINFIYFTCSNVSNDPKAWCWTKPVSLQDSKDYNPQQGGSNWGFCNFQSEANGSSNKKGAAIQKAQYKVYVQTSKIRNMGASGSFYITIFGSAGKTKELLLTESGFPQGVTSISKVNTLNVGDITGIRLRNGGKEKYKCNSIRVELGPKFWDFDCLKELQCPNNCYEDINLSGNQHYEVTIKTSNQPQSETSYPVYISFIGELGTTPRKMLSEFGFKLGSMAKKWVQSKDIGPLRGVTLSLDQGSWKPDKIIVKRAGRDEESFDPKGMSLRCPGKCKMSIMNKNNNNMDNGLEDLEGLDNSFGGGLSNFEKGQMIQLTCDEVIKDNEKFGPNFSKNQPNFKMVLAQCPDNCYKEGNSKIYGYGVHPQESGICKSAILDNAVPLTGGIIGIGVTTGIDQYEESPKNQYNMHSSSFKQSEKSFFTFKVDSPDLIWEDVRIMDAQNKPSYKGRLEVRINGQWGTVCNRQDSVSQQTARLVCRQMNYNDGYKSLSECSDQNGEDLCGPELGPILMGQLKCEGTEKSLHDCYKSFEVSECTHQQDLIIECSSVNYDVRQQVEEGTIRIVGSEGEYVSQGRLEYYLEKWGSVSGKLSNQVAKIACKQMGYDDGKGITEECSSYEGRNYCGDSNQKVSLNKLQCNGDDQTIQKCSYQKNCKDCGHMMDALISCEGGQGDPSGNSQSKKNQEVLNPPNLGKLPMMPIITADCQTTLKEEVFRGDPGSIFIISCPENCQEQQGTIWGTSIYSGDSSLCRAAIHAGVNNQNGGIVLIVKQPGLQQYFSSTNRLIQSSETEKFEESFSVSKPTTLHLKLSQLFATKQPMNVENCFLQENSVQIFSKLKKDQQDKVQYHGKVLEKFLESQSFLQIKDRFIVSDSFLQIQKAVQSPGIFEWFSPSLGFEFKGAETDVQTSGISGIEKVATMTTFSIVLKVQRDKSLQEDQVLVGYSNCGGIYIYINKLDEVIFQIRCSDEKFPSGFYMPEKFPVIMTIVYDGMSILFYFDGQLFNRIAQKIDFKNTNQLDIGRNSQTNDQYFIGKIFYVLIYDYPFTIQEVQKLILNEPFSQGNGISSMKYTVDNRLCLGACTTNPLPGSPGAPSPPLGAILGQADNNMDSQNSFDYQFEQFTAEERLSSSIPITCQTLGNDRKFNGPTGKSFRVKCPRNCLSTETGNVFGTQIYCDSSSICKAAIHAGYLRNDKGGDILFLIGNGEDYYPSSYQNNIQSAAHGPNQRSIIIKQAPTLININCDTTAMDQMFKSSQSMKYLVHCDQDCSKNQAEVFGDKIYSADSSICKAALHSGMISDKGGEIEFIFDEGQQKYVSKKRCGIVSQAKSNYIKSIRILGDPNSQANFFSEIYMPTNIFQNWAPIDSSSVNKQSDWTFDKNPTTQGLCITQRSRAKAQSKYGTMLMNKMFSGSDFVLKANFYQREPGFAAIVFRYQDEKNYYALEINSNNEYPLRLIRKFEGQVEQMAGNPIKILKQIWYKVRIAVNDDDIQVWLQMDFLRNIELVLKAKDEFIQKGGVALSTDDNDSTFFDGVQTTPYDRQYGVFDPNVDNQMVWDQCLIGSNKSKKMAFCKSFYGSYQAGVDKCLNLYYFCQTCCDQIVPKEENVRNYDCYKSCLKSAKQDEKRQVDISQYHNLINSTNTWIPRKGEKCDYVPQALGENTYYLPAVIERVEFIKNEDCHDKQQKLRLSVKFLNNANQEQYEKIVYPNSKIEECGKKIKDRTDCQQLLS